MRTRRGLLIMAGTVLAVSTASTVAEAPLNGPPADPGTRRTVVELLDRMPLLFVPEQVSADGATGFAVRGREASLWLSDTGISYRLKGSVEGASKETAGSWVVALDLVGATPRRPAGQDPLPTTVSFFRGPKEQWRTGLPSFGAVRYREPWPGVDLVVSGTAGELETTFVVRPDADPGLIRLAYRGATAVRLEPDGSLVVDTPLGEIREKAPFAYQEIGGERVQVAAAFELEEGLQPGRQAYRFRLGEYDPLRELIIDPVTLVYCGYIGGRESDEAWGIAVDADGNAYVVGRTGSTEARFPVTVGPDLTYNGGSDAFVAKINAAGTALDYCGYIGGEGLETGDGIAVDGVGNAYITGMTRSTEATFPITVGPDLTFNGGDQDAYVARVSASGTRLEYCGYIGGSENDYAHGIAVDAAGNAYITGMTRSTEATFPVTVGPDLTYNGNGDAFVARVNASGTALDYCGFIGGSEAEWANGIAVDAAGNAYITGMTRSTEASFPVAVGPDLTFNGPDDIYGSDAFVAKVNAAGTRLDYCGYIGGSEGDEGTGIAVDAAGNAYITGYTKSTEVTFPVTVGPDLTANTDNPDLTDAFVAKVNPAGTALDYCGYVGGSDDDDAMGIAVDTAGNAYITGRTNSTEATFPVTVGPDLTFNGYHDAYVARINAAGTALDYCGYIGGADYDTGKRIAVDAAGNAYVVGLTNSTEATFPVRVGPDLTYSNGVYYDAFVAKVSFSTASRSFIPAAAVAAGAEGAFFQTDVEINNAGAAPATVTFQWLPRGRDNSEPLESDPVELAPGESLRHDNVLDALFGLGPDSAGALALVADSADVIGMSRTYNVPSTKSAGTFGQGLPAIREHEMLSGTDPWRIIFLSEDTDSRANVGCVNGTGSSLRITLAIFDAAGTQLDRRTMNLDPYSSNQLNRVLGDWQPVDGYVDVWADRADASYYCYGSMLDNLTSDPTTILPQAPSDSLTFIPATALAAGLEGAFFQTDVDLNNVGSADITYQLLWLPRGDDNTDPVRSGTFSLMPGAGVRYANVLAGVFDLAPDKAGALAVEASGAELLAMSRTYNVPSAKAAGTFGQELPGIPADRMIPAGATRRIIFMNENEDVRSNVGCQNAGLETATVKIELHDSSGELLDTKTMRLPPYSNNQITRVFRDFAPISAGYVDVWTDTDGASIYCYGSVLDNATSDPTTVLPQ